MSRRKRGLSPLFAISILLFVVILCFGVSFFTLKIQKTSLAKMESKLPESAISSYLKEVKNNNFDKMYENSLLISPHLNSKEDYINKLNEIYGQINLDKVTYVQNPNVENLYQIIEDNKLVSEVQLVNIENKWIANTIFTGDNNYTIQVPTGLTLQINGINVDESYITEKNVVANNFSGLANTSDAPKVNTYSIKNLISEPSISIENGNYTIIRDSLNGYYYIGEESNDANLIDTVSDIAKTLAKYPTKDSSFASVNSYLIKDSDFYKRISTLDNQWYATHGTATISNTNVLKIVKQSENSLIANVYLDFYVASSSASKTYNIGYQMTLINTSGNWKIAGFAVDNDLNPANNIN